MQLRRKIVTICRYKKIISLQRIEALYNIHKLIWIKVSQLLLTFYQGNNDALSICLSNGENIRDAYFME